MKILILGANGFIGSHLTQEILHTTSWHVVGLDLAQDHLQPLLNHPRFTFKQGDMCQEDAWLDTQIQAADVVIPLVAIATPKTYVSNPLLIFELDFAANLRIIQTCVTYKKRLIFPSTSEVYGMCTDAEFNEELSNLIVGPIHKERWIYSTAKQLLDRLIYAYGKHHGLAYTIFRPFNWYGPRLDNINNAKHGGSRVITQFIGNMLRGDDLHLVDGGTQQRCFTYIDDGIAALMRIIANQDNVASQQIFNIGNPYENHSIATVAACLLECAKEFPDKFAQVEQSNIVTTKSADYFGDGYQDIMLRVPDITKARQELAWTPAVDLQRGLYQTVEFYCRD